EAYIVADSLTGSQDNKLALKLQDSSENEPWNNQNVKEQSIDATNTWQELTFTFNDAASMARDDVDRIIVQFNGENNTDKVTAYIKNVVGSYTEPSSTTVTPNDNLVITFDESWTTDGDDKDVYGDAGATVTIIDDPSNSNKGKVLNVQYNESANDWQNAQMILNAAKSQKALDLRTIKTVTFDVWTSHDDSDSNKGTYTGLLKLENRVGGGSTIEKSFPVAGNGWETVTVDFSDVNGHEGQFAKIVLFTNYGSGTHKKDDLRIYDNFKYAEGDAFQADAVPATAAPTPTVSEVNVMNIYSDAYSNTTVWSDNEIRAGWSSGGEVKEIDFSSTDKMLKLKEANYIGQYWTTTDNARGPIDLTKYDKMSVDVWVEAISTDKTLGIALLTSDEKKVDYTIAAGDAGWRTIELNVSDYGGIDAVNGVKWEPNPQGSISLMYIDNFYAYDSTLSIDDLEESTITIYPNPSTGIVNITGVEQVDEIRVFTISGQLVKKAENTSSIDLSSEMRGLYMIEIESDGKTIVNRLIKE
ncbi:MAG: T9SS type A sorting domain-containing protein, partial [Bacteroidota bacterium]|nr:T9SS type A sorting domain-containing protein [Bacteroidota bacterium]